MAQKSNHFRSYDKAADALRQGDWAENLVSCHKKPEEAELKKPSESEPLLYPPLKAKEDRFSSPYTANQTARIPYSTGASNHRL